MDERGRLSCKTLHFNRLCRVSAKAQIHPAQAVIISAFNI